MAFCVGLALAPFAAVAEAGSRVSIGDDVWLAGNAPTVAGDAATRDGSSPGHHVTVSTPVLTGLLALLVIALAPRHVQLWRDVAQAHPWRAILSGFLVGSARVGSGFVPALTSIGVLLIPVVILLLIVACFAGYALGPCVLGSALWLAVGRPMPEALSGKFGVALFGAAMAALIWFMPILGWFFAMGVTLLGIGTLAAMMLPGNLMLNRGHVAAVKIS